MSKLSNINIANNITLEDKIRMRQLVKWVIFEKK